MVNDDITVAMVAGGLGVTILPALSYMGYLNFNIVSKKLIENPMREIAIAYSNWDVVSPVGKVFIQFVKEYFKTACF